MKEYRIAVSCNAYGVIKVIADSLDDAIQHVENAPTMGNLLNVGFERDTWWVDVDLCHCFAVEDDHDSETANDAVGCVIEVEKKGT